MWALDFIYTDWLGFGTTGKVKLVHVKGDSIALALLSEGAPVMTGNTI